MNSAKILRPGDLVARKFASLWGKEHADWHRVPNHNPSHLVYVGEVPLGMFDQEDLYPHLITSVNGAIVAVALGECGYGFNRGYEVAEFVYQPLPQKEIHWGSWFPIYRMKLSKVWKGDGVIRPGLVRVLPGGLMELRCVSPRGIFEWAPLPGSLTRKPAGIYEKWSIVVGSVEVDDHYPRTMVRYDGDSFVHWPEGG